MALSECLLRQRLAGSGWRLVQKGGGIWLPFLTNR